MASIIDISPAQRRLNIDLLQARHISLDIKELEEVKQVMDGISLGWDCDRSLGVT
jgi:hypothetical protein